MRLCESLARRRNVDRDARARENSSELRAIDFLDPIYRTTAEAMRKHPA